MMTILNFIIATIVISFCISALVGCYLYKALKNEFDERIGRLEARVPMLEERSERLEDRHLEPMVRYH